MQLCKKCVNDCTFDSISRVLTDLESEICKLERYFHACAILTVRARGTWAIHMRGLHFDQRVAGKTLTEAINNAYEAVRSVGLM